MTVDDPVVFKKYVQKVEAAANVSVSSYNDYLNALKKRHDFFASMGCSVSDHGLEHIYADDYTESEIKNIFDKVMSGTQLSREEITKFKSAMLVEFARWDWEKGWVQQYHLGALRNNNSRMLRQAWCRYRLGLGG
jgi:D-glucuronate isomerase (EC 5.3.1.12)